MQVLGGTKRQVCVGEAECSKSYFASWEAGHGELIIA